MSSDVFPTRPVVLYDENGDPITSTNPLPAAAIADFTSSFVPNPQNIPDGPGNLTQDAAGALSIRGPVLTDEGSFRDDFVGSSLATALTGTLTFVNGSTAVTGSGTAFSTELSTHKYIKLNADGETALARISSIESDTALTLVDAYTGTSATGASSSQNWMTQTPAGGGAAITVGSSLCNLLPGTSNANTVYITRSVDYLPLSAVFSMSISQRIANQSIRVGFQTDTTTTPTQDAIVTFSGTDSSLLTFETSFSSAAADTTTTTVTLPQGLDTSQVLDYEIDLNASTVSLVINSVVYATHRRHLPGPYTVMEFLVLATNTAVVTATTVAVDTTFISNTDRVQIFNTYSGDPTRVVIDPSPQSGTTFGQVSTAAATDVPIRTTTYTAQTVNFTGSVKSSNANDTAAGTGARTIRITYLDQAGVGPKTEVATLNGTTAVNLVATDKCLIEKIEVLTAGSTGATVGTVTLFASAGGVGTNVWSIAAADVTTQGAHHYVPVGKTSYIQTINVGTTNAKGGDFMQFYLTALEVLVTNAAARPIVNTVVVSGSSASVNRPFGNSLPVAGPALLLMRVIPNNTDAGIHMAGFDWTDR
jgi:hypothetical protein